jgi:hypothetical protein
MRRSAFVLTLGIVWVLTGARAHARPTAPSILCASYPDAPDCRGRLADCSTCHTSTWPPAWNEYGNAVLSSLSGAFEEDLPYALYDVDRLDSDGDGIVNGDELLLGTAPGDPDEAWPHCAPPPLASELPVAEGYDFRRAFRRVGVLYCGRSPTYEELADFDGDDPGPQELYLRVHARLDECLASEYWRDDGLARLADPRIRPIGAVGIDSPVDITIGDFEWDYRLFSYVMTGDRDARDLLLADYHVRRNADGTLERTSDEPGGLGGQPLARDRRAGMITTQWFFAINTMFSPMPRTTAAQAYRAYLGADIAHQEGIWPVEGEPRDVDRKGVTDPQCTPCHSTLDPLSYAFASYNGIAGANTGTYDASRPARLIEDWSNERSVLLGQPVRDVREWAEVAAASDQFARNLAMTLFEHAVEREPTPAEQAEVDAAWAALPDDGWSANRLIHRLVDTTAFGGTR